MSDEADETDNSSAFEALIGKSLLIGLSFYDENGTVQSLVECDGPIIAASPKQGIVIRRSDTGERFAIPPALDHLIEAEAADYKLRSSGRVVSNPDLLATFDIYPPAKER